MGHERGETYEVGVAWCKVILCAGVMGAMVASSFLWPIMHYAAREKELLTKGGYSEVPDPRHQNKVLWQKKE